MVDVRDSKLMVKVIERLRSRGVKFTLKHDLKHGEVILVTDNLEVKPTGNNMHVVYVSMDNFEGACELVKLLMKNKLFYDELKIGIDPGTPHVIAIVGDNEVIEVFRSNNIDDIIEKIKLIHKTYPHKKLIIRLGCGVGFREVLEHLSRVKQDLVDVRLELVDESGTSKKYIGITSEVKISRRDYAAINIALKRGVEVQ